MNPRALTVILTAALSGAAALPAAAPARTASLGHPALPPPSPPLGGRLRIRLPAPAPPRSPRVSVIQTSADLTQALASLPGLRFAPGGPAPGLPVIRVNDTVRYQRFTGVGAAMTDASAWLIWDELGAPTRDALLRALFGPSGIGLDFLRVPVGASDYTATGKPYTYDDVPAGSSDPALAGFSIAHDDSYILPALRAVRALDPRLYVEAVPWSPPAWMKANDALDNGASAGVLLPADYGPYAQYLVKFLQAYAGAGVPITALAPANEPTAQTGYPGLELPEQQEAAFVTQYLRPALAVAGLAPSVFGWDLSWGSLGAADPLIAATGPATPRAPGQAPPALTGLAWHCYFGSPSVMSRAHYESPAMQQIVDECSPGAGTALPTSELMIASLRNWANAVALWNLALDPAGQPVQAPNGCPGCTGVATVTESTGTYVLSRDFYDLGQLSRFVVPGAVRISSPHFVAYGLSPRHQSQVTAGLDDVAFENPDGSKVLLAYDNSLSPVTFAVAWHGSSFTATLPAGATTTFRWR
jgi:glucosylceramidase